MLARVSPQELEVLATAQVTEPVSWTLPTLVSTTLYLRDQRDVLALDLSQAQSEAPRILAPSAVHLPTK